MVSRYAHVVAPIHSDVASPLDVLLWSSPNSAKKIEIQPDETKDETKTSNAGVHLVAGPAFRLVSWRWRRDLNPRRVAPHALSRRAL
jgi:hypothetical protein